MNAIKELQEWFISQCNGQWEHHSAINITTCDNPGWIVNIDLNKTNVEKRKFELVSKNISQKFVDQSLGKIKPPFMPENPLADDWMICFVKDGKFTGAGDAQRLEDILTTFSDWVKTVPG